jgi:hypothetical protein
MPRCGNPTNSKSSIWSSEPIGAPRVNADLLGAKSTAILPYSPQKLRRVIAETST